MKRTASRCRLGLLALLTSLAIALCACGYHTGTAINTLPPEIHVIAVPPLANHTRLPQLSQQVTAAIVRTFIQRTHYRIQPETAGSDAVLHGDVLSMYETPVTFDPTTGRASMVEVVVTVRAWLVTRQGKELYRNNNMVFRDQYQISSSARDFFEEQPVALQRLSRTIAQEIVSGVLENF